MTDKEAPEGEDPKNIPLEQRIEHKNWKCRAHGFEELAKQKFPMADTPDDIDFKKYASSVKNFVQDSNAAAHEKGLEAAYSFVDNASPAISGKVCSDVVAAIIGKCFTARQKQKEKGVDIILLYFEIEKQEATLEELVKGLSNKSPKIVSGCLSVMRDALRTFGSKYVTLKLIIKPTLPLLEDRDKSVRDEARALLAEVYRWSGEAIRPALKELKPAQMTELESEFEKHKNGPKVVPEKLVRSEQAKAKVAVEAPDGVEGDAAAAGDGAAEEEEDTVKAEDLVEPVNIMPYLTEDFFKSLQSAKWSDRKDSLDILDKHSSTPKIAEGDFSGLITILQKIVAKDSNVVCVALGAKCLANMAKGLNKKFSPYAHSCVSIILEKFKEKKANVVTALQEAIDGCFLSLTLEQISQDIIEFLGHKTPSVKAETTKFLVRCFSKFNPEDLPKKLLKVFLEALIKNTNDPDATVRDSAFEAIGTAYKVVGEKTMAPFLVDVDDIKKKRIEEYRDKAVITAPKRKAPPAGAATKAEPSSKPEAKVVPGKKPVVRPGTKPAAKPAPAPAKAPSESDDQESASPAEPAPAAAAKKVVGAKGKAVPAAAKPKVATKEEDTSPNITGTLKMKKQRENDEKLLKVLKWSFALPHKEFILQLKDQASTVFSNSILTWMFSDDFKNHIKAIQSLQDDLLRDREATIAVLDVVLRWFTLRFFDTNPQVLAKALEYLQLLFKKLNDDPPYTLTEMESSSFLPFLLMKTGDPKEQIRKDVQHIVRLICNVMPYTKVYSYLADGMNAKVTKNAKQREGCLKLATWAMESYGLEVCGSKPQDSLKIVAQQVGDRDKDVREAALKNLVEAYQLLGTEKLFKFIGANEMPKKDRDMIEERIKRAPQKTAPAPTPTPTPKSDPTPAERPEASVRPAARYTTVHAAPSQSSSSVDASEPTTDSASDSGASTQSKASAAAPTQEKERDDTEKRPATVTLKRQPPQLIPISSAQLDSALGTVEIPKLRQNDSPATDRVSILINSLMSDNPETSLNALKKIDEQFTKNGGADTAVKSSLADLYRLLNEVLKRLSANFMPNYPTNYQYIGTCYGHVLHILRELFKNPRYTDQTTAVVLSDLIHNLIMVILDRRMELMIGGEEIVKNANLITLRIVDNANRTQILCASIRLLRELLGSGHMTDKFLDLVIKCLWRCVRKMPENSMELQVEPVFLEVHLFLKQFPAAFWQTAGEETPFRTIKTIVYTLTKMYGSKCMDYLTLIDDPQNSELASFLKRIAKTMEKEGEGDHRRENGDTNGHSPATHASLKKHEGNLSSIVQKVGSSDDQTVQQVRKTSLASKPLRR
ncbi:hypothetical protein RvY_00320-2 [Ramazzottius varieornatus]|uniref:TOG domain-containing protein n=1 Tax=Ramazzottius varieornatus TaxID=947166 RepID=A0A1D1UCU8_RAMVA|nr:hypothetical protein RvY_00320-2 [Ramazzottius varieornatus]